MKKFVFVLLLPFIQSCSTASFVWENGIGQWQLFNRTNPVEDVLASPYTKEETKKAIRVVGKAKDFAVSSLGLKATKNYSQFVQLDSPCVIWAISAADSLELVERKWRFPIVGEVPYLGFFKKPSAEKMAKEFREEAAHPDVWMRCVPAFSTLGWFPDPLYSSMLHGRDSDIAELVIHESLHATVWVGDSVEFNEKLANFVGLEGSLRYLAKFEGERAVADTKKHIKGEKLYGDFLFLAKKKYLEEVRSLDAKEKFYHNIGADYKKFLEVRKAAGDEFEPLAMNFQNWNNAAFLTYLNYYSDFSVFEAMLKKCDGDLHSFVEWISRQEKTGGAKFKENPEDYLRQGLITGTCK